MNDANDISVHDNRLVSYEVHCERREIRLSTEFRDRGEPFECTDVLFTGVVAYDFRHDSSLGTIIFDVAEVPAAEIFAEHANDFHAGIPYGWPGEWAESAELAAVYFQRQTIRGFRLSSSLGMDGWVLARDVLKLAKACNQSA